MMRVAVIGAGTMGRGIAYVSLLAGCEVRLHDAQPGAVDRALESIDDLFAKGVQRGKLSAADQATAMERLHAADQVGLAVKAAAVVIEAVVEDLAIKQRLFADVERAAPADALLASNTSSLSIGKIAEGLREPRRLVGMHFFNPVHAMKLVEVVTQGRADGLTDGRTVERAVEFARQLGKEPIVVRDSPGFASSRLGIVLGLEAMRMLEQGVASAEDIDKAMELGYNHPMGPLKLTDLVGLDVRLAIAEYLHETLGNAQYEPPRILRDKVSKGELGRKTGKGFYTWSD
jgi:3-hydroxybutyryl-CoA dehydrogenase